MKLNFITATAIGEIVLILGCATIIDGPKAAYVFQILGIIWVLLCFKYFMRMDEMEFGKRQAEIRKIRDRDSYEFLEKQIGTLRENVRTNDSLVQQSDQVTIGEDTDGYTHDPGKYVSSKYDSRVVLWGKKKFPLNR
jgi:hypothetical protein